MVEAETVTPGETSAGLVVLMELIEDLVTSTVRTVWERNGEEMELFSKMENSQV